MIRSPVADHLEAVHEECRSIRSGAVADYIPALAKADPDWFGVVLATVDGQVYEVGDTRQTFTIQSVSKPFAYGAMLDAHGQPWIVDFGYAQAGASDRALAQDVAELLVSLALVVGPQRAIVGNQSRLHRLLHVAREQERMFAIRHAERE